MIEGKNQKKKKRICWWGGGGGEPWGPKRQQTLQAWKYFLDRADEMWWSDVNWLKFNDNGANLLSFNEDNKKITQAAMVQASKDF
jgi:hypothetical protein